MFIVLTVQAVRHSITGRYTGMHHKLLKTISLVLKNLIVYIKYVLLHHMFCFVYIHHHHQNYLHSIQFNSIQFNSIQFNSIQFNSIQFNSIQFNNFIPDSTEHIQQVYVTLRSICYIRYTICAVYKSTEQ